MVLLFDNKSLSLFNYKFPRLYANERGVDSI